MFEPHHEETNNLQNQQSAYAKLKAHFSFAVLISAYTDSTISLVSCPAFSHHLCLYSSVCVGPVRKNCWFSHEAAQF